MRSTMHATLDATPSELVFGRDVILPLEFKADWEHIRTKRQLQINKDNIRENKNRLDHSYSIGDRVLVLDPISKTRKLERPTDGPFIVTITHDNGKIRIQKGAVDETLSVRRIMPFRESIHPLDMEGHVTC